MFESEYGLVWGCLPWQPRIASAPCGAGKAMAHWPPCIPARLRPWRVRCYYDHVKVGLPCWSPPLPIFIQQKKKKQLYEIELMVSLYIKRLPMLLDFSSIVKPFNSVNEKIFSSMMCSAICITWLSKESNNNILVVQSKYLHFMMEGAGAINTFNNLTAVIISTSLNSSFQ